MTDVRKTLKANLHSQKDEWGFKEWEEQRKGDASSSLGSLWLTDVLDSSSNSLMGSMDIYISWGTPANNKDSRRPPTDLSLLPKFRVSIYHLGFTFCMSNACKFCDYFYFAFNNYNCANCG